MDASPDKHSTSGTLIVGRQPLIEAIESGRQIDKIFLQANTAGDTIGKIRALAKERGIPIQVVPPERLRALTRLPHQGVVAQAAIIVYEELGAVIDRAFAAGGIPLFVMLDGITDVRNIGAIARTAVCCGAQAMIIPDKGVGALNEEAMKASAGALSRLSVCRVGSLLKALDDLHARGIRVFVSAMKEQSSLADVNFAEPACIIMGSEGKGVQPYLSRAADERFFIPMAGNFDSFNVSVAAGIILYEAMRQRQKV